MSQDDAMRVLKAIARSRNFQLKRSHMFCADHRQIDISGTNWDRYLFGHVFQLRTHREMFGRLAADSILSFLSNATGSVCTLHDATAITALAGSSNEAGQTAGGIARRSASVKISGSVVDGVKGYKPAPRGAPNEHALNRSLIAAHAGVGNIPLYSAIEMNGLSARAMFTDSPNQKRAWLHNFDLDSLLRDAPIAESYDLVRAGGFRVRINGVWYDA